MREHTACLYGIGVGPGDPQLMTLQAFRTIQTCDIIALPAKTRQACHAYQIVEPVYPEIANMQVVCLPFPMLTDPDALRKAHDGIYQQIAAYLEEGQNVGMLTIGDPSIYATYIYIHQRARQAGFRVQMISGVPSFCAVASKLGISLVEGSEQLHVIPGSYDVRASMQYQGTCVYMKSGRKLSELLDVLEPYEAEGRCVVYGMSDCGMPTERAYDSVEGLRRAEGYLTTVIVKFEKQ